MTDFSFAASSPFPLSSVISITCSLAVVIFAVIQSGKSSDDDGPGDGGLMQPVGAGA
ncbi:MAG: hypothetical protein VKL58_00605 [Cyanobacteriota bacterium]|nr:hypothetical protein [Cyanobacteriota bacterium]